MNWLARLKKADTAGASSHPASPAAVWQDPPKPAMAQAANDPASSEPGVRENLTKPALAQAEKNPAGAVPPALAQPPVTPRPAQALDPDRWCWPYSEAMTGREIDTMMERTTLFNRRGLPALEAELLADKLVNRDRDGDDRRLCLECGNLSRAGGAMRCNQWQQAGMGAAGVPAALVMVLQRCDGFKPAR